MNHLNNKGLVEVVCIICEADGATMILHCGHQEKISSFVPFFIILYHLYLQYTMCDYSLVICTNMNKKDVMILTIFILDRL